jgi:ATP-dependent helicase/nuclease subunit B
MSVQFLPARAGTGKTHWCLESIADSLRSDPLGPAIYWILPRQATFQAQRQLACTTGLNGYFRARILSFEDLGRQVLSECGGSATAEVSELGRRIILGHLLRKNQDDLIFFRHVARHPGVAAELDATFAELDRCAVSPVDLQTRQEKFSDPTLNDKLHDLALIFGAYEKFLGQDRIDPIRRFAEALAAIGRCPSLRGAEVYVDSFYDFSLHERQVLTAVAKTCKSMFVTMLVDPENPGISDPHHQPDDLSLFYRTEKAYQKLYFALAEEGVRIDQPLHLKSPGRFQNPDLKTLERWEKSDPPQPATGGVRWTDAYDRRAEVDAAARWITQLAAHGYRYRDIAVLMRSEDDYHQLIDASFHEHGIPFFIDRRRTAAHHPLLRLIRAALAVALTRWAHEPVMAFLKTGLAGLDSSQTDALENYVLQHGIHHTAWIDGKPWTATLPTPEDSDDPDAESIDAQKIQTLRQRLVDRLLTFTQAAGKPRQTVRGLAGEIFKLLDALNARGKIADWMQQAENAGNPEERDEHKRVWDELVKLFDELVDLLGDEPITLEDFSGVIDSALEGFDLAIAPPTVDQVLVGPVDRTRTPTIKACAILGLSEGQFPHGWRQATVFTDSDRRVMQQHKIDLEPDTQRKLLDENFLAYIAFTRASDHLLLTRATADESNRLLSPSIFWTRSRQKFTNAADFTDIAPRQEELPVEKISTPRQLVGGLMRWVRGGMTDNQSKTPETAAWRAIYQWLATHATCDDDIDIVRYRAWKALSAGNSPSHKSQLDIQYAAKLFPSPFNAVIRQIESFRACPFQHFARYGLQLRPRRLREIGGDDLSRVYHDVLNRLAKDLIQRQESWADLSEADAHNQLDRLIKQAAEKLKGQLFEATSRNRYLLDRIHWTLAWVISAQRAAAARGDFRPIRSNVHFRPKSEKSDPDDLDPLLVSTPNGREVFISGKIDRIDLAPDGSVAAVDYRLRKNILDASETYHGLSLQLLTCLLVLQQNGKHLSNGKITPVAAFYVQMLREIVDGDPQNIVDPNDERFRLSVKPRGIFDFDHYRQFDKQLISGRSDVLNVHVKKEDGELGNEHVSDAVRPGQMAALLVHAKKLIGDLAERILSGDISVRPYQINQKTPCPRCEFRDVCRFQPAPRAYADLESLDRREMLQKVEGNKHAQ